MKNQRGGKRKGAGRKSGSTKPDTEKRTIRKLYQWTPDEYEQLQEAVKVSGVKESKIVQSGTLQKVKELLQQGDV